MLNSANQINQTFGLLYTYSYLVLFPLVVIEGPIVTIIAGFLVSLGFMDFWPAYLTIIAGDLTGDILYYSAGRWWLKTIYTRVLKFFDIRIKLYENLKETLRKNKAPFLFFGKLSHAVGGLILFAAGDAGLQVRDFLWFNFLATIPKSLILLAVGYYFGSTVSSFGKALDYTVVGLFVFTLVMIGIYFAVTYFSNKFIRRLEK